MRDELLLCGFLNRCRETMRKFNKIKHLVGLVFVASIGFFLFATYEKYNKNKYLENQCVLFREQAETIVEIKSSWGSLLNEQLKEDDEYLKKVELYEEDDTKTVIMNAVKEARLETMNSIEEFDRETKFYHARIVYFESYRKIYSSWFYLFFPVKNPVDFSDPTVERPSSGP